MREQTLPKLRSKTGLFPGMLKRTKYSRLRNDSLTSLEDRPQRMLPLKRDLCLDSDFAQLNPGTPTHQRTSTLRDFIPRVTNIRLQSPISLHGLRGQTNPGRDGHTDAHTVRPLSRTNWGSGTNPTPCGQHSLSVPHSTGQNPTALSCTKRPITLNRMTSLPWTHGCPPGSQHREGLCSPRTSSAEDESSLVQTADRAVHHHIKYMGSVEVTQSMRTLDFYTRMQVTREAISRLCERTSAKTTVKTKRPVCKGPSAVLGQIDLQLSGSRIILAVSTDSVTLIAAASLQRIAHHPMQAISFASGGDPDMADYIAYVAKDRFNQRACHILECPPGRASEVINSIGQAFETRFRELLRHTPPLLSTSPRSALKLCHKWHPEETATDQRAKQEGEIREHHDYYNVIPGKTPPACGVEHMQVTKDENREEAEKLGLYLYQPVSQYENCSIAEEKETTAPPADSETQIPDLIQNEGWFHGRLSRDQAESLLTCSGDFLVRESSSASGQYVLSGVEGSSVHHLLLVDPHGQVRTRDQVFLSVGHLVRFHMQHQMPILCGSSKLCLKQPVLQSN